MFKKLIPFFLVVLASLFIWISSWFLAWYFPYEFLNFYPTLAFLVWIIFISIIFLKFFKTAKEFVLYFLIFLFIYSLFIFVLDIGGYAWYLKYCSNRIHEVELKLREELLKTKN